MDKIYLSPPHISKKEIKAVTKALKSGWIAPAGSYVTDFTSTLDTYFTSNVLLTNSGSSAIHLALKAIGIKKNDIVLCSNFTFAASAFPILYEKAIPHFIGIERETWNISPKFLREAIAEYKNKKTQPKALILAYCYGYPAKWNEIKAVCEQNNIVIIEDAAESLGSTFNSKPLGSFGDLGILSFNGNKIITCSSGGALISQNKKYIEYARKIAHQAKESVNYYLHNEMGYNYTQSNILAAIGYEQFKKLAKKVKRRREIYQFYIENLSSLIRTQQIELNNSFSNRWLSCFTFENADQIQQKLTKNNIESRKLWNPLHLQPAFAQCNYTGDNFENELFQQGLCLPSGSNLKNKDLNKICNVIKENN